MIHKESSLQINCVTWFRLQYPNLATLLFSVPNGGLRRRTEARIMKAEGMTAGVSDLILLVASKGYHSLCIEMKYGNGRQTEYQKMWQQKAEEQGNKYIICRSVEEFIRSVSEYLNK